MLLKLFKSFDSTVIYIQIWKTRIKVSNNRNNIVFDDVAVMAIDKTNAKKPLIKAIGHNALQFKAEDNTTLVYPFEHERIIISDFELSEKTIQHAIEHTYTGSSFFRPSAKIIIQSMEYPNQLSQIEIRVLKELGLGSGGREVVVYDGMPLEIHSIDFETIKKQCLENN